MKNLNFHTAYTYIQTNYGLNIDQLEFESSGMIAYDKIGNKQTEIKEFVGDVVNGELELPCDVTSIEAVFGNFIDSQKTSNKQRWPQVITNYIEQYIEYWKYNKSLLYDYGVLLNYQMRENTLLFDKDYKNVLVLYRKQILDEAGFEFESLPSSFRHGSATYLAPSFYPTEHGQVTRHKWISDFSVPLFNDSKEWLNTIITTGSDIFRPERDYDDTPKGSH